MSPGRRRETGYRPGPARGLSSEDDPGSGEEEPVQPDRQPQELRDVGADLERDRRGPAGIIGDDPATHPDRHGSAGADDGQDDPGHEQDGDGRLHRRPPAVTVERP